MSRDARQRTLAADEISKLNRMQTVNVITFSQKSESYASEISLQKEEEPVERGSEVDLLDESGKLAARRMFSDKQKTRVLHEQFEDNEEFLGKLDKRANSLYDYIYSKQKKFMRSQADRIVQIRAQDNRYQRAFRDFVRSEGGAKKTGIIQETETEIYRSLLAQLKPVE